MRRLLFGTTNPAKVAQIQAVLAATDILVEAATDISIVVEEDGETAQDNARKKALAYARATGEVVLAMDNGLYFEGLSPEEQPGIHVRRMNDTTDRPSDDELRVHYQQLIKRLGNGEVRGWWEFALCVATPTGQTFEITIKSPRRFVSQMSPAIVPGYPLESLQIDPTSGRYISEMTQVEQAEFWQRAIGEPIAAFLLAAFEGLELKTTFE